MAASLLAMLSQQTPNLPTRKALILTGLQHDFLSPEGKLPVSNLQSGFLDRTKKLIDEFRGHGDIIWVRTEADDSQNPRDLDADAASVITSSNQQDGSESEDDSEDDVSESDAAHSSRKRKPSSCKSASTHQPASSRHKQPRASHSDNVASTNGQIAIDEEHFLTRTPTREPCFIKGTIGAAFADDVKSSVQPTDLQIVKSCYSAFNSTSLLLTLRSKLITELYICGAMTNLNVYATSMDAARYGITVTLVEDCLGYRKRDRHDLAIKRLVNIMDARVKISNEVSALMRGREITQSAERAAPGVGHNAAEDALEVASSDEDDNEEDLLSVRATPCKSHRPLEIRGSRAQDKGLQELDTGSEPDTEFQRPAATESIAGCDASQRESENAVEHTCEGKAVEFESSHPTDQQGIGPDVPSTTVTGEQHGEEAEQTSPANRSTETMHHLPSSALKSREAQQRETTQERKSSTKSRPRNRKSEMNNIIERHTYQPLLGLDKEEEISSSSIHYDLLPPDRLDGLFHRLKDEVSWQRMHHQTGEVPRLVCCQGAIDSDGSMPVYRHPSDETLALLPWTPAVDEIRRAAEAVAGHTLNHALIQLYRAGTDFISEHSDKTIDVIPGSFIVNASFGAERVMRLRTKRIATTKINSYSTSASSSTPSQGPQTRVTYRIRLPHNSALLMSLQTNAQYLHSINADKRAPSELTPTETAYDSQRISLTFRQIGTFLDANSEFIWGQGATGKDREDAKRVVRGDDVAVDRLTRGFGAENAASNRHWEEWYGEGSDVLHLK